ncbi:hypothetical protein A7D00_5314 [Trichophyton violaceum]|uniref:Uncharacterized protein n=1 Tax=Trichophyton violaceum TaxID=34388 RepID=A0A178FDU6_TRIVO|nr:hypothetical protein A7D00_5314 [Trichophyton violaceum]
MEGEKGIYIAKDALTILCFLAQNTVNFIKTSNSPRTSTINIKLKSYLQVIMPKTLTLVCYKQSRFFPENTAHWGLLLQEQGAKSGRLFHVTKESYRTGMTDYRQDMNIVPTFSASLRASVEVASGLDLDVDTLDRLCIEVARGRRFDFVVNNCQRFCAQVLQRLVQNGTITQAQFDALATKGFRPLV